ncbi:ER membrane protein complex subunit 6-like isoform X1 [Ptychodera flava]|uniref:ER membrane protein complex subunit 6-like isoform X1 n=1 Tax=Ptychodera flava TaxID=63121 RepID=UPI00396A85B2
MAARGAKKENLAYSEAALRGNKSVMDYCRTSMSALSGATAGVLGLTGLYGFIFYVIASLCLTFMLVLKAGSGWNKYFRSRTPLLTNGFMGGLFISVWNGPCVLGLVQYEDSLSVGLFFE